ncbi:hypothetical protein GUJ93_ZPchr0009g520 [Zizania palustris]|uniref:ethanolamine kinase n=1 Tax=Zizania palustris TaxID=103762 RepID=A0A8J5S3C4_ZIZPA|nr:hypothetical protein GUJ93_ZPchr0009g520 [Zizania palustris]
MGSEGRNWSGTVVSGGGSAEEKPAMTVVAPAPEDVPVSVASVDIALPPGYDAPHHRNLQGFGERVVISGQLALLDRSVLKVSVDDGTGNKLAVTVRLYGPNTDLAIPYLSAAGFGAQLLGTFENGMVQSFIYARTLTPSDMKEPRIAAEIAKELHRFHQVDIPGSKEPQLWDDISKFLKKGSIQIFDETFQFVTQLSAFMSSTFILIYCQILLTASVLEFEDNEKQKRYETISFREIRDEVKELKDLLDLLHAPVVFAHNDLLSGNLMLNDLEGRCQIHLHILYFDI